MVGYLAQKIITLDSAKRVAEAIVAGDGLIDFVGTAAEARRRYGSRTDIEWIDLGSATVVPGFNDTHLHAMSMGQFFNMPRLRGLTRDEIIDLVSERWADAPHGELLMGRGWDYPTCPDPDKALLDRAFPSNPVALIQFSGHGAWLNSRALELFGIDRDTPDPQGGEILRDADGEPTGIVTDDAVRPIHMKRFLAAHSSFESAAPLLQEALDRFGEAGLTSVQDNTWDPRAVGYYRRFLTEGRLTARFSCWSFGEQRFGHVLMRLRRYADPWIRRGPVKFFLDGTFSTRTAWMLDPYPGEPSNLGTRSHEVEWFVRKMRRLSAASQQVAAHAIGDGAVRSFVDAVERAAKTDAQAPALRHRVEHGQLIHPRDIERMARLGIVVSAQPHAAVDPEKDREILGGERARRAYPFRSLLDAGVPLSFGSDVPGEESYNPMLGIHLAVNRESPESITVEEAISCYTAGSAYAEFEEHRKGRLATGMFADFVALAEDPTTVNSATLKDIGATATVVAGRVVYRSS